MIYNICPQCGANLDPGEKCDCKEIINNNAECRNNEEEENYGFCKSCRKRNVQQIGFDRGAERVHRWHGV